MFNKNKMLNLNLQFFAEGGDSGTSGVDTSTGETKPTAEPTTEPTEKGKEQSPVLTDETKKFIQSEIDKGLAEERKKSASLQKEIEKYKKEKMTADELKKYEAEQTEKKLQERENALLEKENKFFALEAIKEIGLDDGGKNSLDLIPFVMAQETDAITERVKVFKELVDRFVKAEVDKIIAANGRVPHGANAGAGTSTDNNIAVKLGKQTAETQKQSNEILKHYYGG